MTLTKLGSLAIRLANKNLLSQRLPGHGSKTLLTFKNNNSTISGKKNDEDDDECDEPIVYSTSKAATWSAEASRTGVEFDDKPWFQSYVITASVGVFMIYFCVLREENDVDEKLSMNLSDHFQGEARANLEASQEIYRQFSKQPQAKPVN